MTKSAVLHNDADRSVDLLDRAQQEIDALRQALDAHLSALEAALANPDACESLETLVLDLARVATREAEAAAQRAVLGAQMDAKVHTQSQLRAVRAEAQKSINEAQAALDAERTAGVELRLAAAEVEQRIECIERATRAEVSRLNEQFSAELARERSLAAALTQDVGELQRELASAHAEREARVLELDAVRADAESLERQRADLERLRTEAEAHAKAGTDERDALASELEAARQASIKAETEAAVRREALETERANFERAWQEAAAGLETAASARDLVARDLEAARQAAATAEADARARYQKLFESSRERIRGLEIEVLKHSFAIDEHVDQLAPTVESAAGPDVEPIAPPAYYPQRRRASRHLFQEPVQIQIDDRVAQLVDLSALGAQMLSPATLKPNSLVTLLLPLEGRVVSCEGTIVWARFEPSSTGASLLYRAGVCFTTVDAAAVEAFTAHCIAGHRTN